jgi:hypothetical protein
MASTILSEYEANPNIQIQKVLRGMTAFETGQSFLFPNSISEGTTWATRWSTSEKQGAVFFLYVRKKISSAVLGFKLIVGEDSILGEELPFEEGLRRWSS